MASTEDNEDTRNKNEGTPQSSPQTSTTAVENDLVAAVEKLGYGGDTDRILAELKLQSDKNNAEAEEFATKIINMSTPCVFVFMKQNSPNLHVIHSLGKFTGDLVVQSDYSDSVIGFVGNRAGRLEPIPIEITNDMWSWKDHEIATDIIKVASFGEKEGNEDKMYKRTKTDDKEKVALPPFLLLPSGLVKWLLEKRRKPLDLHQKIKSVLTEDSVDDIPEYLNVSLKWCLAAAQCARTSSNEKSSLLVLTPSPIITQDLTTLAWIKARLNTTLGPPKDDRTPSVPPPQAFYQMPPTQSQNYQPTPQTSNTQGTSKKYSELQKSALGGWCGTANMEEIDILWHKLEEYQLSTEECRTLIMNRVAKVAEEECVEVSEFYLEDEMVNDIVKMRMAPNGRNPVYDALHRGMCVLNALPSNSRQRFTTQQRDKNRRDTSHTRTLDEAEKLSKKDPRKPAGDYERLFKNVSTRHACKGVPTALALFTDINKIIGAEPKEVWIRENSPVHKAIVGFRTLLQEAHKQPTKCRQLVVGEPSYIAVMDAAKEGAGGVIFGEKEACEPTVFRFEWPKEVQDNMCTFDNPSGHITNSDLELAGFLLAFLVLELVAPNLTNRHIAMFCDNSPTISWVERMATRSSKVAGQLLIALAIRMKESQVSPLTPLHIAGRQNSIGDIPSRSFGGTPEWHCKTDKQFLELFNSKFTLPNQQSWKLFRIPSALSTRVISVLLMKNSGMAEWRRLPKTRKSTVQPGKAIANLWELTLHWRKTQPPSQPSSEQPLDLQPESGEDTTVEDAKLQLEQSLRLSRPLARRSQWTQEATPSRQKVRTSSSSHFK